jgi:hypothetical protein
MSARQSGGEAGYIAAWAPSSVPAEAAAFARTVVAAAGPHTRPRAKNLLWAAGKLAGYGMGLGLEPVPEVLLHPSVIERFAAHAPGLTGVTRRTLRTSLRFLARRVVPQLAPADAPLPRERAKRPYAPAEIDLVCPGAGAGLIRADLRAVRGSDICCRSGGVIVTVCGRRPRVVPVLARYHDVLLALRGVRRRPAGHRGDGPAAAQHHHPAGHRAGRRHRAAPAGHQPAARHLAGRLRAASGPGHVPARSRDHLQPAAGRHHRQPAARRRGRGGRAAGRDQVTITLAALEAIIDTSGIAPRIEVLLPAGVRHRQLRVRTLIPGMLLALDGRRPAFLTEVHAALTTLPRAGQARLGVTEDWGSGAHLLTCRQVEYTFNLVADALGKHQPDGAPTADLQTVCDQLLEASIPAWVKDASTALAAGWTDVETWSRPPRRGTTRCAGPEASWGHRTTSLPGPKGEMFYGFYLPAATMTQCRLARADY